MMRPMRASTTTLFAVLALAACGGPGSFEGTVNGVNLAVKDSVFVASRNSSDQVTALQLFLTDRPGLCAALQARAQFTSSIVFFATFGHSDPANGQLVVPTAGEYPVFSGSLGRFSVPGLAQVDATCQQAHSDFASGGTVTLKGYQAEAGASMTGSFDLTFNPQGHQGKGSFDADFCDVTGSSSLCPM
jgi:hypothetical protein